MPETDNLDFKDVVENTYEMYKNEIYNYSKNYIKNHLFKKENSYVKILSKGDVKNGEIKPGCIYHFVYNNGGISINKSCLCIEISQNINENGKLLIWCLNLNALPLNSRITFFQKFFNEFIKRNRKIETVEKEKPFDFKANSIYNYLKTQDFNYIIEPLNLNDIKEARRISTNILEFFIFYINSEDNYNLIDKAYKNINEQNNAVNLRNKLEKMLDEYKDLLEKFKDDSKDYHKKLKDFELNLKLFEK